MSDAMGEEQPQSEAKKFQAKLFDFHKEIGSPIRRFPTLGGRELDVFHLYNKVTSMGGSDVVSQGRLWGEVARSFNLPSSVTSASYAIRHHYAKLLEKFEACERDPSYLEVLKADALRQASTPPPSTMAPPTWQSLAPTSSPSWPTSLAARERGGGGGEGFTRVTRSLLSGFPNEVDFSFNVLTVMLYKIPSSLPLVQLCDLLDLMLAHVAIFPSHDLYDDLGLETLYRQCWHKHTDVDFEEFWSVTVPEWVYATIFSSYCHTSCHAHSGLFASRGCVSEWAVEGYRVSQVATILCNLSSESSCLPLLSEHSGVLRFLLLASHCSLPLVSNTGMDTLNNLAPYLSFSSPPTLSPTTMDTPSTEDTVSAIFRAMVDCIFSDDKMKILKGLSVLSQLTWSASNESFLEHIGGKVWHKLFNFLLLPDIQLVLLSLDTLYQFTSQGLSSIAVAATIIHTVNRWCEMLVSLLTVDVQSFGKEAIARVQLLQVTPAVPSSSSLSAPPPHPLSKSTSANPLLSKLGANFNRSGSGNLKTLPSVVGTKTVNSLKVNPNSGGRLPNSQQTIKIGNCVIPVLPGASSSLTNQSKMSLGQSKNSSVKVSSTLGPGKGSGSTPKGVEKGPTILTIQQIQNLLANKNITVSTPTSGHAHSLRGGSSVTINKGSNVTIHRGGVTAQSIDASERGGPSLLRTFLAKENGTSSNTAIKTTGLPSKSGSAVVMTTDLTNSQAFTASKLPVTVTPLPASPLPSTHPPASRARSHTPSGTPPPSVTATTPSSGTPPPPTTIAQPPNSSGVITSLSRVSSGTPPPVPVTASLSPSRATPSPVTARAPPVPMPPSATPPPSISLLSQTPPPFVATSRTPSSTPPPSSSISPSHTPSTTPPPVTATPLPTQEQRSSLSPSHSISGEAPSPQDSPQHDTMEHFATQWLESNYEECKGSYVVQLEMYSLYLIASAKQGNLHTLNNTDFNNLIRRVFPSALSTRVSVSSQAVYMMAGLAKKRAALGGGAGGRDTIMTLEPGLVTSTGTVEGGVVTQQTMKMSRGPLSTPTQTTPSSVTSQTGLTSLRPDYSTQSPLAISSKAVHGASTNIKERGEGPTANTAVTLNGDNEEEEEEELGGVAKAKRIKLMNEGVGVHTPVPMVTITNAASSVVTGGYEVPGQAGLGIPIKLLNKNHHIQPPSIERTPSPLLGGMTRNTPSPSPSLDSCAPSSPLPSRTASPTPPPRGRASPTPSNSSYTSHSVHSQATTSKPNPCTEDGSPLSCTASFTSSSVTNLVSSLASIPPALSAASGASPIPVPPEVGFALSANTDSLLDVKVCRWGTCSSFHLDWASLLRHVVGEHLETIESFPSPCQWLNCTSKARRGKFSLMAHLQASHCGGCGDSSPYSAPNAQKTLARLKAVPVMERETESHVTKAIRLTAALVLRNLAQLLPEVRRQLRCFERELCQVALSGSEASTAVAQCLHYLHSTPL